MLIGVCGFISTGSSAVSDYLAEFDETSELDDFEFVLSYFPDGLEDLDYHLNTNCSKYMSSVVAIERFRRNVYNYILKKKMSPEKKKAIEQTMEEFISNISQVRWQGYGNADYQLNCGKHYKSRFAMSWDRFMRIKIMPRLEKMSKKNVDKWLWHSMEFAIKPEAFDQHARTFTRKILEIMGADFQKTVVLDQPFCGNNPIKSFKFFEDPVAIVVDRDPRDQYLFAKKFLRRKGRTIPTSNVQDFVEYYKRMRDGQPYKEENPAILRVQFEDMIYRYDETTKLVADFCGLDPLKRTRTLFDPKMSINNTQVYKRYPEYAQDIKYIEEHLKEYLYPFEEFGEQKTDGKMFYGKSPLNK